MRRFVTCPGLLVGCLLFFCAGCSDESQPSASNSPESASSESAVETAQPDPGQPVQDVESPAAGVDASGPGSALAVDSWQQPDLALVISGEMHGYFEPCGCTANQLGGMGRRANLVKRLTDRGWTVRGIDLGGSARRTGRQAQVKFDATLAALRELQYSALALGPEELRLDPGYLLSQHVLDGENPLRMLGANLVFYGTPDLGTPLPWTIIEAGGLKVGVTAVMGESVRKTVIPDRSPEEAAAADVAWSPAADALPQVIQAFDDADVDYRILLSQSSLEESRALATQFQSFDIVVSAKGFGEGESQPEMIGGVRMLQVGHKGRTVGVAGLYPQDTENPIRFELVTLTGEIFEDDPRMITLMQTYQDRLRDERLVVADNAVPHPSSAQFVGVDRCAECHTTAYEIWQDTPHAHALESLDPAHQRHGYERLNGVNRMFDPECLSCHVTGWDPQEYVRFAGGFLNEEFASSDDEKTLHQLLAGNQCENCHGPGSRHIELIEADELDLARQQVRVSLEQARDQMCVKCHDIDNSPDFDFESYWEQVKHYGLD
jgi:hypothetical protein